jgi:hypothetical protein
MVLLSGCCIHRFKGRSKKIIILRLRAKDFCFFYDYLYVVANNYIERGHIRLHSLILLLLNTTNIIMVNKEGHFYEENN